MNEHSLQEIENLISKIYAIINNYERKQLYDKKYYLFLANGEKITIELSKNSLAHLLGINIDYLRSTDIFKKTNSYDMLKELCESPYQIYKLIKEGIINYNVLFSKYIHQKIDYFFYNITIINKEIEVICKYDSEKHYFTGEDSEKYDYIIIKKYEDNKIGIIGLVKNNHTYSFMTNQIYDTYEEAKGHIEKYLYNQDITLLNGFKTYNKINNGEKKYSPSFIEKSEKYEILKNYKEDFKCTIDVSGEYIFCLNKLLNRRNIDQNAKEIIRIIAESIQNGEEILIDDEMIVDENFFPINPIINSFNSYLNNQTKEKSNKRRSIIEELEDLKSQVLQLQEENMELRQEISNIKNKPHELAPPPNIPNICSTKK